MASGDGPPLSLRPVPVADKKPKNVADFIARVNAQPGGFRAVTEEKLQEQIRTNREKTNGADEDDVSLSDSEDEDDDEVDVVGDPNHARIEVLKNIDIASNTAMLTLDSLSLLLSKQNPTQASLTLSQQLRDMVGIGTIGADKLDDSNVTPAKAKDGEDVAIGWILMEINRTRDSAAQASDFLRREVDAESRYWEDVVKVQKAGWSICKVPQEPHTLGVRFGFSEAAPEFRSNGLAPMRRGDDGSVQLDCGRLGGVSERLLVTYETDGKVVGRSSLPAQTEQDAPLEARVLEARNTIFAQELWHELSREARSLLAYDVKPAGSRIVCNVDAASKIILELVPLDSTPSMNDAMPENQIAEGISNALHILLSYAHRYNELMRIRPLPPHVPRPRGQQTCALFRPIIARVMSRHNVQACTKYVAGLVATLKKAGLPASFVLHTPNSSASEPDAQGPNKQSAAQAKVRNMLQPLEFNIKTTLLSDVSLTIRGRTFLHPVTTTHYHILTDPSSPLQRICASFKDGYADIASLSHYLRTATSRILTENSIYKLRSSPSRKTDWLASVSGMSIRDPDREDLEVRFAVAEGRPVLVVERSSSAAGGEVETETVSWDPDGDEKRTLEKVVGQLVEQDMS